MNFCSDNVAGAHPKILAALASASAGPSMPYGNDDLTHRVEKRIAEIFECDCTVFLVGTGTAANALALATLTPPYGTVFCHPDAHIANDECGAPEFYAGGSRLIGVSGAHGKIDIGELDHALREAEAGVVHHMQPAALSLTQASEAGTIYAPNEVGALAALARLHRLGVHMDGARFANAVAGSGRTPADLTWRAGVDILSFGATKNGALAAEAVVFFDRDKAKEFAFRRKRGGHLWSKMRFLAAQWDAYLADDLWLENARHANAMARRLGQGLAAVAGARLEHPVDANEVFVTLPRPVSDRLAAEGWGFYRWPDNGSATLRLVTAFDTNSQTVDGFVANARAYALADSPAQ